MLLEAASPHWYTDGCRLCSQNHAPEYKAYKVHENECKQINGRGWTILIHLQNVSVYRETHIPLQRIRV